MGEFCHSLGALFRMHQLVHRHGQVHVLGALRFELGQRALEVVCWSTFFRLGLHTCILCELSELLASP